MSKANSKTEKRLAKAVKCESRRGNECRKDNTVPDCVQRCYGCGPCVEGKF